MKPNEPLRGPKYRSRAFQKYLLQQTPERRAEILAGENRYNQSIDGAGCVREAAERDYEDSLSGYAVTPAGPNQQHRDFQPRLRGRA